MNYSVEYYETEDGTRPAEAFILDQDKKMQAKIFMVLELLEEMGPALRLPYSENLQDGIFEVRAKQGSDISRVLYFFFHRTQNHFNQWICQENAKNTAWRIGTGKALPCGF